jgi:steroid delta-isomerase-like uncharacterized protein
LTLSIDVSLGRLLQTYERRTDMDAATWVREETAAWSSHDIEKTLSLFADDCVYEDLALGRVFRGREELRAFLKMCFTMFPDLKAEVTSFFFSGNRVCIEYIWSGTNLGDTPTMPATGKSFSVRCASIREMTGGVATRATDYYDLGTMMRQLGVQPSAPQT